MMDKSAIGPKELSCFIGAKKLTDSETEDGHTSTSLVSCPTCKWIPIASCSSAQQDLDCCNSCQGVCEQTGSWACVVMTTRLEREHSYV